MTQPQATREDAEREAIIVASVRSIRAFAAWAGHEGYDAAYTYDTERSRHIWLNPMTEDLWRSWQEAIEWKAKQ